MWYGSEFRVDIRGCSFSLPRIWFHGCILLSCSWETEKLKITCWWSQCHCNISILKSSLKTLPQSTQAFPYRHAFCQRDVVKLWLLATVNFWELFWYWNEAHHVFTHPDEGRCSSQLSGLGKFSKMHPVCQCPQHPFSVVVFIMHKQFSIISEN